MKFESINANKIMGAKLELGPTALGLIRIALINSYNTFDQETKELIQILNDLYANGRI